MSRYTILLLVSLWTAAQAQVNRYAVFFRDKAGTPYSISNPSAFLSQRALDRRTKNQVNITEADLPISPAYTDNLRNVGATVLFTSRWFNAAIVQCANSLLPALLALPEVSRVELVAPGPRPTAGGRVAGPGNTAEVTDTQLSMHGLNMMHQDGGNGQGVFVAVFDSGFSGADTLSAFFHVFNEGRVPHGFAFNMVYGGNHVFGFDDHGTAVWSVIAAQVPGTFTGGAPKATFMLAVTEDVNSEYRIEEYNWAVAAERADSAGVDVINTSLGYNTFDDPSMNYQPRDMNGETAVISRAAAMAAARGMVVVVSAGNEGARPWQIITAPADAAQVLATGNVNSSGIKNASSSIGPSADGRIKPDVAALGTGVSVYRANGNQGTLTGTSLAAPLTTSLVAGLIQLFPEAGAAEIATAVRMGASQAGAPDNLIGYGIIDYAGSRSILESHLTEPALQVFPNPVVAGTLTVRCSNPVALPWTRYELLKVNGQLVDAGRLTFGITSPAAMLSFENLPPGIYLLRLMWQEGHYSVKIAKP
ncbi:MAG: serine protease [Cyclobacteriaceae bacterium]|nr:MAG: serine protease [Cyclobacteriaceae bacterium]